MQTMYCWWCGKKLAKVMNGPNKGCVSFRVLRTAGGNDVYVHDQCLSVAKAAQKVFTAQERR
jgi:hypothetical protein